MERMMVILKIEMMKMERFMPNDLLNVWVFSVVLSLVAGVYPAWKASRLSPLEALRR